jgi:hypothetical protein
MLIQIKNFIISTLVIHQNVLEIRYNKVLWIDLKKIEILYQLNKSNK